MIDRENILQIAPAADLQVLEVAEGKSEISINQVREFKEWVWRKPFLGKQKIGIIQRAQKMSPEAQNALLKTLEEPPLSTSIVLLADDAANLLPTVVSRCLMISKLAEVEGWKSQKRIKVKEERVKDERVSLPTTASLSEAFKQAEDLSRKKNKEEVIQVLDDWIKILQSQLIHSDQAAQGRLTKQLREMLKTKRHLISNVNVRFALENLFLKILKPI